jgi:hypothetical protein
MLLPPRPRRQGAQPPHDTRGGSALAGGVRGETTGREVTERAGGTQAIADAGWRTAFTLGGATTWQNLDLAEALEDEWSSRRGSTTTPHRI